MKHKFILFFLALTTSLSMLEGIASLLGTAPNSANVEPTRWFHQAETEPITVARCRNCGQPGGTGLPGGAETNGNSRGGG